MAESRTSQRKDTFSEVQRIVMLEQDADEGDVRYVEIIDKLDRLSARQIGMTISLATAAILLAANIVVMVVFR